MRNVKEQWISALKALFVVSISCSMAVGQVAAEGAPPAPKSDAKTIPNPNAVKVLCAGDSITQRGYPEVLQELLGVDYAVRNAGHSGVTVLKHTGTRSYPNANGRDDAKIVVVMLGTNDTKVETWTKFKGDFVKDYEELVNSFKNLPSKPQVFVALSPPIYKKEAGTGFSAKNLEEALELMKQVAKETGSEIVDVHAATLNHAEFFGDGVHPNDAGKMAIAKAVAEAITGKKIDVAPIATK